MGRLLVGAGLGACLGAFALLAGPLAGAQQQAAGLLRGCAANPILGPNGISCTRSLNTTQFPDGPRVVEARAVDQQGRLGTAAGILTFTNGRETAPRALIGRTPQDKGGPEVGWVVNQPEIRGTITVEIQVRGPRPMQAVQLSVDGNVVP